MDDVEIAECSWKKLSESAKKAGFAEGANRGRESVFQQSFDEGYALGFDIGASAGYKAGLLRASLTQGISKNTSALNEISKDQNLKLILDNAAKGQCSCCIDESLLQDPIGLIKEKQTSKNDKIKSKLQTEFDGIDQLKTST